MLSLKDLKDQALIDELLSRGYKITKEEKRSKFLNIMEHIMRNPEPFNKVTGPVSGASAMRPTIKTAPCTCDNQWCEECSPNPPPESDRRFCRCGSALCPICRNNWGS